MKAMTKTLLMLAAAAAFPALAQAPKATSESPKPVSEGTVVHITGTIEAISPTTREVTVNFAGQRHTFAVKPDVKRFSELKVGDTLSADYHEAVVMEVRKAGAAAPKAAAGGDVMRVPGQAVKPSGALVQQQTATVLVKAIDPKTPSITVETDEPKIVTMKVEHPERLKGVKVGDKIDIFYTVALIVRVE